MRYQSRLLNKNLLLCTCNYQYYSAYNSLNHRVNFGQFKLCTDIEKNPGPSVYVDATKTIHAPYCQGNVTVFGENAAFIALIPDSFTSLNPFVTFFRPLQPHSSSQNSGKTENFRFKSDAWGYAFTRNKTCTRNQVVSEWVKNISIQSWVELHFTTTWYILNCFSPPLFQTNRISRSINKISDNLTSLSIFTLNIKQFLWTYQMLLTLFWTALILLRSKQRKY